MYLQDNCKSFDWSKFESVLKTEKLGRVLVHSEIIASTFNVLEGDIALGSLNNVAVVADHQTSGRGRADNHWISPRGCAMISFQVEVNRKTSIAGLRAPFLLHLASCAVVHSLKSLRPDCKELDVRIKVSDCQIDLH